MENLRPLTSLCARAIDYYQLSLKLLNCSTIRNDPRSLKINSDKHKNNNYLKLKSEVEMAVLKSKQIKLVEIISTYVVQPYV